MHLKTTRSLSAFFLLLTIVVCSVPRGGAQQTLGAITGTVTDATGNVLSGVAITVVGEQTSLTRVGKSSGSGSYDLVNLPIGSYTVTFTQNGFEGKKYPAIQVQADRTVSLNAQLKVGSVSDSITVEASPMLNAVDTTNGYILDRGQIESVPLPTGSYTGLAILSPGVNAELPGGTGSNSGLGNQPIWANGQRDTSNSFLLNGVDASNLFNGKSTSQVQSARVVNNTGVGKKTAAGVQQSSASVYLAIGQALPTPAPETLSEVRVNASMYDAQQGSNSGAHIDVSTGSGTNLIHGTGYFHRGTDWLNAAPFFYKQSPAIPADQKLPQLHRYTAGGTIGAPIIKDKLFAYLGYQHLHVSDQEIGKSLLTVPFGLTDDRSPGALASLANNNFGAGSVDPASISPVALFLMQHPALPGEPGKYLIPSANPNITADQLTSASPYDASLPGTAYFIADQAVGDLDWNAGKRDTVSAKYYYQHDPTVAPYAYSDIPGFTQHLDAGSHVASLTNTLMLTPNLSTTQVLGFIRMKAYSYNDQPFTAQDAGINTFGSSYFPGITIVDALGNGNAGAQNSPSQPNNPNFLFDQALNTGTGSATQGPYTGFFQNRLMPSANAIWTHGKHTVTFGSSYSYTQLNIRNKRIGKGMIASADFAGFLNGQVSFQNNNFTTTSLMLGNADRYYRSNQVGSYVQDKFQVTPTLSLTAGLRYDWNGGLTEKYGRLYNFDPSKYSYNETTGQVITNGFLIAGNNAQASPGVSNTTLTGRQWGIAPRLGLAYQPSRFESKVVIRSGFGLYYDRGELFSYLSPGYAFGEVTGGPFGVTQAPPFVNTIQCPNSIVSACTGNISLSNPWGTTPGTPPSGKASDITNFLPSAAAIAQGTPLFALGVYDRANKLPYSINYTLDVQWQPRNDLAIDIGYVGNLGRHQVVPIPFNQAKIASASAPTHKGTAYEQDYTYGYALQNAAGCYFSCAPADLPNGNPYLYTGEGGNIDLRVPYTGYSAESETYKAVGISAYNALTVHVEKRMSHGIQVGFSYTYSHAIDEQSALGLFYNGNDPTNLGGGYGSSDFDRTHVINFTYAYQLPHLFADSTYKGRLLDNWSLVGLTVIQSGQPYSVVDYSGAVGSIYYGVADGITNPIVPLAPGCSPKKAKTGASGAFTLAGGKPALDPNCFTIPLIPAGGLGGAIPGNDPYETDFTSGQRNIFRQPYQKRADMSLIKTAKLTERVALKYTFDVFNLTNTSSFDIPGDNVNQNGGFNPTPLAGQPASPGCQNGLPSVPNAFFNCASGLGVTTQTIGSPRQIQMSLRATF